MKHNFLGTKAHDSRGSIIAVFAACLTPSEKRQTSESQIR